MADKTGAARLRQAVENQAAAGEACLTLPVGEARALCDEVEDELAGLSWAAGVSAPVDADGEAVPLDATELYTDEGEVIYAGDICLREYLWYARSMGSDKMYRLDTLHLTERDSWELLEKDVSKAEDKDICGYFGFAMNRPCSAECPARDAHDSCAVTAMRDVMRRAKALAGRDTKGLAPQPSPHEAKGAGRA